MRMSETVGEIAKALAAFQHQCPPLKKTSTAVGKKFSYKYIDLADVLATIKKPLAENGLAVYQTPVNEGERVGVVTLVLHASGEFIESPPFTVPGGENAQDAGGAVTYARRYALTAALGIAAEEDTDGATGYPQQQRQQQQRQYNQPRHQEAPPQRQGAPAPGDSMTIRTSGNGITPAQVKALKAALNRQATQHGMDTKAVYEIAADFIGATGKATKELNKQEASRIIEYLNNPAAKPAEKPAEPPREKFLR